jgi:hypothetical protein
MPSFTRPLGYIVYLYWTVFWLLNGLDKFMHGETVRLGGSAVFMWFGKDRSAQFASYFDRLSLPQAAIAPLLNACGAIEVFVALLFAAAIVTARDFERRSGVAFAACALMFVGFSVWDIVVGDRAELLEHGTYLGVVFISAAYVSLTGFRPARSSPPTRSAMPGIAISS